MGAWIAVLEVNHATPGRARARRLVATAICLLLLAACDDHRQAAETSGDDTVAQAVTVVHGAWLYTLDEAGSTFDDGALAFDADGSIRAVGATAEVLSAYPDAVRVEAGGAVLLPGLIDAHGHLAGLALDLTRADLTGTRGKPEIIERLRDFERTLGADDWLLGRGWDQNDWPKAVFPGHGDLDAAFPERPVWLVRIDGHAGWGNSAAMAAADRDLAGDWQPKGGLIQRDAVSRPTGIFIDGAMALIEEAVPPTPDAAYDAALDRAVDMLLAHGLTGVHDPGVDRTFVDRLQARLAAGRLPLRVYAMADGMGTTLEWLCAEGPLNHPSGRLVMRAVKLYADGALGSRGAALLADYDDEPGNRGLLFHDDDELEAQMRRALECGLQLGIHAIGDAANRQVLNAYERLLPEFRENPGRHRIEHAQVLAPADIPRFGALGVIASMQPVHATSDMYWAGERLGPERAAGAYAWRSVLDAGGRLALGSDFPVEAVDPMPGIQAAVTRRDLGGWPPGGWYAGEALTRAEALRGFTRDAAYAAFMESQVGSLETGKRADFILLNADPFTVPEADIHRVRVLETWVDGQRVWQKER